MCAAAAGTSGSHGQTQIATPLSANVERTTGMHGRALSLRGSGTILETLGNVGEFVGGLAVIITLAYLALQVRQGTASVRASSVQELTENMLRSAEALGRPENAELYLRGASSYSSLTPEEKLRFGLILGPFLARFDTVLEYRERGMVNDSYVAFHADTIRVLFENPGVREWSNRSIEYRSSPDRVRRWLDENISA